MASTATASSKRFCCSGWREVDRKLYQWISQLVRDKPNQDSKRPLSQIGRQVQAHYACGYISGKLLVFSAEDKRRLRQQIKDELGLDPFVTEQLPATRLAMARYHADEKLAAKPASDDQLLLNSADGILRINNAQIQLHPQILASAGLQCLSSGIDSVQHQTIVVVENLAVMPLCHRWLLPLADRQALWVYRGDYKSGAKANTCLEFVQRFGTDKTVIVFSDMDPKGLEIALTTPYAKFWLGPNAGDWRSLLASRQASRSGFDNQTEAMTYLLGLVDSNSLSAAFKQLIAVLCEQRSSFRQEHAYSLNAALALIAIEAEGR